MGLMIRALLASAALAAAIWASAGTAAASGDHCVLREGAANARCYPTSQAASRAANGDVVVGIGFSDRDYGGATLTFTADYGCGSNGAYDHSFPSLQAGWNDTISSYQNYGNCWGELHDQADFGGANVTAYSNLLYVGDAMNDRTSAVRMR